MFLGRWLWSYTKSKLDEFLREGRFFQNLKIAANVIWARRISYVLGVSKVSSQKHVDGIILPPWEPPAIVIKFIKWKNQMLQTRRPPRYRQARLNLLTPFFRNIEGIDTPGCGIKKLASAPIYVQSLPHFAVFTPDYLSCTGLSHRNKAGSEPLGLSVFQLPGVLLIASTRWMSQQREREPFGHEFCRCYDVTRIFTDLSPLFHLDNILQLDLSGKRVLNKLHCVCVMMMNTLKYCL